MHTRSAGVLPKMALRKETGRQARYRPIMLSYSAPVGGLGTGTAIGPICPEGSQPPMAGNSSTTTTTCHIGFGHESLRHSPRGRRRRYCASMSDIIADLGYRVDVAHDGPAALELSRRHSLRAGRTRLQDTRDGRGGTVTATSSKSGADTVGVLVTAFAADTTIHAAVQAGIRQVLPKPVDFGHLIPLIGEVAGSP